MGGRLPPVTGRLTGKPRLYLVDAHAEHGVGDRCKPRFGRLKVKRAVCMNNDVAGSQGGGLFRSISNRDAQSKLYIFVKSEIIRPTGLLAGGADQLQAASERNHKAFERHEQEFQNY
jgi:hypothetical protein